jgi:hypothetical protein
MKKELNIKVKIDASFEVDADPSLNDWNEATNEQRDVYVKERVREFLLEKIDEIIDELMDGSNIEF